MIEIILIFSFIVLSTVLIIKFQKQLKWFLTPLIWLKDILDVQWWAEKIFYKLKLNRVANNPYKRWLETLPMKKKIAIELLVGVPVLILMDHYFLMPYFGLAILPWNWDWSGG